MQKKLVLTAPLVRQIRETLKVDLTKPEAFNTLAADVELLVDVLFMASGAEDAETFATGLDLPAATKELIDAAARFRSDWDRHKFLTEV